MNKELIYTKDYVVVNTDNGLIKRDNNDDIEKILKVENNIEEINNYSNKLTNTQDIVDFSMNRNFAKDLKIVVPISFVLGIILGSLNIFPFFASVVGIPVFSSLATMFAVELKALKDCHKHIKTINLKQNQTINNELENQKEKLKDLNERKVINENIDTNNLDVVKKIEKTDVIDNLKRKLKLIVYYEIIKEKNLVNNNIDNILKNLECFDLTNEDIVFLQELIDNDLKENIENESQKTLKKVK